MAQPKNQNELLDLWRKAASVRVGICIETPDRQLLREQLYRARAEHDSNEFAHIVITVPKTENELWLVKKDADQ